MPHSIYVDTASRTAFIELTGTIDGAKVLATCRELFSHPEWERGFSTLWDANGIRKLLLTPEDTAVFETRAEDFKVRRGPGRSAVVATDVDVKLNALVLGRKAQPGSDRSLRLFSNVAEAKAWLAKAALVMG